MDGATKAGAAGDEGSGAELLQRWGWPHGRDRHQAAPLSPVDAAPRPALLIANENSRRGGDIAAFEAALHSAGVELRRESCPDAGSLPKLIRAVADEVSAVLLGGGDGTMHAAAPGLRDTGLPLGILPLGTANDLARSLDIPTEPEAAAAVVTGGRIRKVDLGTVNGIPFFNVASMGLSVDVTKRLTSIMKRRLGPLAYPIAAGLTVLNSRRFSAGLRADGREVLTTTLQIAVGSGRFYGGGNLVEANADISDGLLNVYSLEPRARWRLLLMARAFRAGTHHELAEVRSFTCKQLQVTTKTPREINADGEIVTQTPADFGLLPGAVRVFVP